MLNSPCPRFALAAVAALVFTVQSSADDYVDNANKAYKPIAQSQRSDLVLLPLIAKMDPTPRGVSEIVQAALLPASSSEFAAAREWAQKPAQRAVIDSLAELTKESDWRKAHAFGQPYGAEGVPPDLIRAGMYTELGDPPTLAAAQFNFLPRLDALVCLVNIEATRLAADGKPNDAIDVLTNLAFFCRSMCDRQFFAEAAWGLKSLGQAFHRMRDIGYTDMQGPRALNVERLLKQIERLAPEKYLDLSRMTFPGANRLAVEQMIARVYEPRGGVKGDVFGTEMARLGATEHPLRLFSETARWRDSAASQANWVSVTENAQGVFTDWQSRWQFEWFDKRQLLVTKWTQLSPTMDSFAVIKASTPDMGRLSHLRQIARVEGVGTRHALAVVGATYERKSLPRQLSMVRPRFIAELEDDPYNPNLRDMKSKPPLQYFVPMSDETPKDAKGDPIPYEMSVVTDDPSHPLTLKLTDNVFVLYSFGSDNAKNFARLTQNTPDVVQGADYLLFPPLVSLHRQHLLDLGQLK